MPVDEFAKGLQEGDHAGNGGRAGVFAVDLADGFPGETGEFAQEFPVAPEVAAEVPGDGEDKLAVGHGSTDGFRDARAGHQCAFLVTRRAEAAAPAGEGDEEFMAATGAADATEAVLEVAAGQIVVDGLVNDRAPRAVTFRIVRGIVSAELREEAFQQAAQGRRRGMARAINLRHKDGVEHGRPPNMCCLYL